MVTAPVDYNAHSVEAEVLALWKARRLPPPEGVLGPSSGPVLRQFEGTWTQGDFPSMVAYRALTADIDARYLSLVGRRAVGTLRQGSGTARVAPSSVPALLTALGIWVGGDGQGPWDFEDRTAGVQAIVGRLATKGILVTRDETFRLCPECGTPRSPERILYNEQEGDTFLVRFPVRVGESTANALVWVDAPWKLLGTSALLVNPGLRYVVASYRRRDDQELVLTSRSSLARLRAWIPEAELEVVEERTGRELQGAVYAYPLRHEFPMGGDLSPPAGTILAANDVGDSGTGIVPLVPGHGPTDARIAGQFGVSGWPLVTPRGKLDFTLMHKYAGLDLDSANEFVERDLAESGALLARLRVKRGVPHCTLCGTPLLWVPGRAWCLEASRLAPERRATFARLLPRESLPGQMEVAPWPVSEATSTQDEGTVALLECTGCDRLEAPGGAPQCPCGGQRSLVHRRLLPSSGAAFAAWARFDPFPDGDPVHLYVGQRRRVPSVVNHLAALSGVEGSVGEVTLTVVPTVQEIDLSELVKVHGADAVRAALVRSGSSDASSGRLRGRCEQESRRIGRWWMLAREVVSMCDPGMLATFARPIGGFVGELEAEDRALIARWERSRVLALSHYDQGAPSLALRRASRFLDNDLVEYRAMVQPRLQLPGTPTTKRAALRTLAHVLRGLSEVLAPILPFSSEAVHRSLSEDRTSLFEQASGGLDRSLLNDDLFSAWDRWRSVLRSLEEFRRCCGVSPSTVLPSVALVLSADDVANRFRQDKEVLARLARVQRIDIGSPKEPWTGRQRAIRPVESEIQKAYGSQASQVIHLLHRMPARRWEAALGQDELSVVINGLPRKVLPSMVSLSDTLPDRVVLVQWTLGEMYAEIPSPGNPPRNPIPPLTPDAFWVVRRIHARLRPTAGETIPRPRVAIVTAKDPLAGELRSAAEPLARYLGLAELRVVTASEEAVPPNSLTGRTRTGERWSVHVPQLPVRPVKRKQRSRGARRPRVSVAASEAPPPAKEVDYAAPSFIAHEEEVRGLGQELDDAIGIPLLGPSKVAAAWDHGVHSVEDLRNTPFDTLVAFPGFGGPVAGVVMSKLGGSVPLHPPRRARRASSPRNPPHPSQETRPTATIPSLPVPVGPSPDRSLANIALPPVPPTPVAPSRELASPPEPARGPWKDESTPSGVPPTEERVESPPPSLEQAPVSVPSTPGTIEPEVTQARESDLPVTSRNLEEAPVPVISETPSQEELPTVDETIPVEPSSPETVTAPVEEPQGPPEPLPVPEEEPTSRAEEPSTDETPSPTPALEEILPEPEEGVPSAAPEQRSDLESQPSVPPTSDRETGIPTYGPGAPGESTGAAISAETSSAPLAPVPPPDSNVEPEMGAAPEAPEELPSAASAPEVIPAEPLERPAEASVASPLLSEISPATSPEAASPPEPAPEAPPVAEIPPSPEVEPEPPAPSVPAEAPRPEGLVVPPPPPQEEAPSPSTAELTSPSPVVPEAAPLAPPASPNPVEPVLPLSPGPAVAPTVPSPLAPPGFAAPPAEPLPPVPPSGVELTVGDSIVTALNGFLESTAAGHHGVCVVRESPERIRARVGSRPIEVIWLTNIGRGPALRPSDLDGVWAFLCRKLFDEHVTAFFLEGIEYLVRIHGADSVLTGLVEFDRLARESDARVWVFLAPALMKPVDIDRFRGTFGAGDASS